MVVMPNFQYCLLIWLFCSRAADNLLIRTTLRAMRIIYNNDNEEALDALMQKDGTFDNSQEKFAKIMVEIYKTINHLKPPDMWYFCTKKVVEYDFRTKQL